MNARSLPKTDAALADIELLECAVPCTTAISACNQLLSMQGLDSRTQHLHLDEQDVSCIRLSSSPTLNHDITALAVACSDAMAQSRAMHAAIAQWAVCSFSRTLPITSMTVEAYCSMPGVAQAFPELMPLLANQSHRHLAVVELCRTDGTGTLCIPLAMLNPSYLDAIERGVAMSGVKDDFDYSQMRQFCATGCAFVGADRNEALLQGLLNAYEQMCASEFHAQGIHQRTPGYIRRILEDQIPLETLSLLRTAAEQHGSRVHLLSINCDHDMPTMLAYVDHASAEKRYLTIGTGFTAEHAASRALHCLIQQAQIISTTPENMAHSIMRPCSGNVPMSAEAKQHLHTLLETGQCVPAAFHDRNLDVPSTLEERCSMVLESFKRYGVTPWCLPYSLGTTGAMTCMQVVLVPFQSSYLLQQGLPVMTTVTGHGNAANQPRAQRGH